MYVFIIYFFTSICGEYLKQGTCCPENTYINFLHKKKKGLLAYLVHISILRFAKDYIAKQ